jgi:hypothetical protein
MKLGLYSLFCVTEFEKAKGRLCFPAVRRSWSLNSISAGISELSLKPSFRPLRARGSSLQRYVSYSYLGTLSREFCWVLYYNLFALAAAPITVVVWPDNEGTLLSGLSRNVTWVWSFSRSGANRRLRLDNLCIVLFGSVAVWTDQGGPFLCISEVLMQWFKSNLFVVIINCYQILILGIQSFLTKAKKGHPIPCGEHWEHNDRTRKQLQSPSRKL